MSNVPRNSQEAPKAVASLGAISWLINVVPRTVEPSRTVKGELVAQTRRGSAQVAETRYWPGVTAKVQVAMSPPLPGAE